MKVTDEMIDPQLRFYGKIMKMIFPPTDAGFRRMHRMSSFLKGKNIRGFNCSEAQIGSRDAGRTIRLRTYRPKNGRTDIPGVLYIHGGGYALNIPESEHGWIRKLLNRRDCVIVSPDYRLSGTAPYPAALDDCYDSLKWMAANSRRLGFNSNQLFVIGGSAGGGLTAALTLLARDKGKIRIAFQAPLYPMLDHRMATDSMREHDGPVWSEAHNRIAWQRYIGHLNETEITEYASPALNNDFRTLPPAATFIGSLDPFLDETLAYFSKLEEAGVETRIKVFEGAFHGFEYTNPYASVSQQAVSFFLDCFDYAADNYFSE